MKKMILLFAVIFIYNLCNAQSKTIFTYDVKGDMTKVAFTGSNTCSSTLQSRATLSPVMLDKIEIQKINLSVSPVPANSVITLNYTITKAGFASIEVYDMLGNQLPKVYSGFSKAGTYSIHYSLQQLSAGTYSCVLRTKDNITSKTI